MSSPSGRILRLDNPPAEITVALSLLITAFTPLIQLPVHTPLWHSFMLSIYCVMMMLCAVTLIADVSIRRGGSRPNLRTHQWNEILQAITLLTGSLAVISLLSINKPYIGLFWLLVWLLFATHLIRCLIWDLSRPILPRTFNAGSSSNYVTTIVGKMKIWATNLVQWCAAAIPAVRRWSILDRSICDMVQLTDV